MLADTYRQLANLLRNIQKPVDAEKSYRQALAIHEKLVVEISTEAMYSQGLQGDCFELANLLESVGQFDEVEKTYRTLIKLDPKNADAHNNLARLLATCPDAKLRDPHQAVTLGKQAVELEPKQGMWWNTLGVAHYRAGDGKAAIAALEKSMELRQGGDAFDWFFLAMAHWQLGDKKEARKWYDRAVEWMEKNDPKNEELGRFRAEAEKVLGVKRKD